MPEARRKNRAHVRIIALMRYSQYNCGIIFAAIRRLAVKVLNNQAVGCRGIKQEP